MSRQAQQRRPHRRDERRGSAARERERSLSVLQLVTTPQPFFTAQLDSLSRYGVDSTTLSVPGTPRARSITDFASYYPGVLRRTLRCEQWDVVHANFGLVGPHALAQPVRPVVLSLWGTDLMGRYGRVSRWCARRADAVVVMSEEMAAALGADCHVIPHGIDLNRFRPRSQQEARADLGWNPEAKHVLFPYALDRRVKNYNRAKRVVREARRGLDGPVELHAVSGVAHDGIPTYMNAADVLLMTSRREGSPNAVKEALACDLPVVSTDVGDVRDRLRGVRPSSVHRTDAGLVNALGTVFERGVRSNGRETMDDLSLERTGKRLRDVYETVSGA